MPMTIDNPQLYAEVFISQKAVEFAHSRTRDPADVLDEARARAKRAIELRNAEIVRHYTPTAEAARCLTMALKAGVYRYD